MLHAKMSVTVFLSVVIYIRNDNMCKKNDCHAKCKKKERKKKEAEEAVLGRRGEEREGERGR